jgi:hypothetical protein
MLNQSRRCKLIRAHEAVKNMRVLFQIIIIGIILLIPRMIHADATLLWSQDTGG